MTATPLPRRAVFFDRDDTLIRNVPYLGDPGQVELLPGARACCRRLLDAGFALVIVSNQSGVGRGYITLAQVAAVNAEMFRQIGSDITFLGVYNCYAAPDQPGAEERKPSPVMIEHAAAEHGLDTSLSFFVGDRLSDVEAGHNAGCRSVLVATGTCDSESKTELARQAADVVVEDLNQAADWILAQSA